MNWRYFMFQQILLIRLLSSWYSPKLFVLQTGEVLIKWRTESELDNAGFNIHPSCYASHQQSRCCSFYHLQVSAFLLSAKWDQPYSRIMAWLRCRHSFSLVRSSIMCTKGARSSEGHVSGCPAVSAGVICREAQISC